jgi:hypothetical protein
MPYKLLLNRTKRAATAQRVRNDLADYRRTSGLSYGASLARAANWLEHLIRAHNAAKDVDISERVVMTSGGHWATVQHAKQAGAGIERWHWSVTGSERAFEPAAESASESVPALVRPGEVLRTRSGRVITEAELDGLAAGAEAGYDIPAAD